MIDLHCHILPGLDDGPRTLQTSIEMARQAADDGIRTIVATPHINSPYPDLDNIEQTRLLLQEKLLSENIPITLLPGGEVDAFMDPNLLKQYTLNNTPYLLVEFPHSHWPSHASKILFEMISQGLYPIIAHPERNPGIIRKPQQLLDLLDSNVKIQITAGSLAGQFGNGSQACARYLLKKRAVHFLATDAHGLDFRCPILSKGRKVAAKILGKQEALKLVEDNPKAVIEGLPIIAEC